MNKYFIGVAILTAATTLAVAAPTFAETNPPSSTSTSTGIHRPAGATMKPFVIGTVSAISGNTITLVGRKGPGNTKTATTTYTVDATNAKIITKSNATSTVSSIVVGDNIAVQGTLTGTNISATMIRDGIMSGPGIGFGKDDSGKTATSTHPGINPTISGNGEPIVAGTISSINSSTISITNKSNITYTIDASNAKVLQDNNKTINISDLKTGDNVIVQGTVNGTSVVASSIIDQAKPTNSKNPVNNHNYGFFGDIGQFFKNLFGF